MLVGHEVDQVHQGHPSFLKGGLPIPEDLGLPANLFHDAVFPGGAIIHHGVGGWARRDGNVQEVPGMRSLVRVSRDHEDPRAEEGEKAHDL